MFQLLPKKRKYRMFASYSHDDMKIVGPLISLLTPCYDVFYDKNSIEFGMKWQVVIEKSINECHGLYIFWCTHSAKSRYVKKEYEQALMLNKRIFPVLMDKTPLPEELGVYQAVDFTEVVAGHSNLIAYSNKTPPKQNDKTEEPPLTEPNLKISALSVAQKILNTNIVNEINKIVKEELQTIIIYNPKENFGSLVNRYIELENRNTLIGDMINPIIGHTKHKIIDDLNFKFNVTDFNKKIDNEINPNTFISGGKLDFS